MNDLNRVPFAEAADLMCGPADKIRAVMRRLNEAKFPFQLVVDGAQRLAGVLTDGDLRRAMLRADASFEATVADCMNKTPISGKASEHGENLRKLRMTRGVVKFLPVLDDSGRVVEVLVARELGGAVQTALVMAGGAGRRLGALTSQTPKPLLPVGGQPILERIFARLEEAGVNRIYLSVHHMSDQFERFVSTRRSAAQIQLLHEKSPLGTAGAIGLLPPDLRGPFLVMNGDVLTEVDYAALDHLHRRNGNDATIGVASHAVEIPYGVVRHNDDGVFLGIDEKPTLRHFVAAGIYLIEPACRSLASPQARMDMPELLNAARSAGLRVGLFPIHEYWKDVGQPHDLRSAEQDFSNGAA